MLESVEVLESRIVLTLIDRDSTANDVDGEGDHSEAAEREHHQSKHRQIVVPCTLGQQPILKEVVAAHPHDDSPSESFSLNAQRRNRARLIEAIHRSRGWLDDLMAGKAANLEAIATRERRSTRNVGMMLNLAFLAPDIIVTILSDDALGNLSASHIAQNLPLDWDDQRRWITAQG